MVSPKFTELIMNVCERSGPFSQIQSHIYRHAHLCSYNYVITVSQVHSGSTQQHYYCSGYLVWYYSVVKINIGNDIGFPNEHVTMNRLDTY